MYVPNPNLALCPKCEGHRPTPRVKSWTVRHESYTVRSPCFWKLGVIFHLYIGAWCCVVEICLCRLTPASILAKTNGREVWIVFLVSRHSKC